MTEQIRQEAETEFSLVEKYYKDLMFAKRGEIVPTLWSSPEDCQDFVRTGIDAVMFDCDGVIYRTPDKCPGASECIQSLMETGKKIIFVTNNFNCAAHG